VRAHFHGEQAESAAPKPNTFGGIGGQTATAQFETHCAGCGDSAGPVRAFRQRGTRGLTCHSRLGELRRAICFASDPGTLATLPTSQKCGVEVAAQTIQPPPGTRSSL